MSNAIERLATELMNLSSDAWLQLAERRTADPDQDIFYGPSWDEISERLAASGTAADLAHNESTLSSKSPIEIIARGKA